MSDIFISYARKDIAVAEKLVQQLQAQGWSVFWDRKIPVGRNWDEVLERELPAASAVVVLWSAASRGSDYVREEAGYGKTKKILFPAVIEQMALPFGFSRVQAANLIDWNGSQEHAGLTEIVASLRQHLEDATAEAEKEVTPNIQQPIATALPEPGNTFRGKLKIGGDGPLMLIIPAGRLLMGSPPHELKRFNNEGPQHEVHIARPFAMGVYTVTFAEYDHFCENTKREKPDDAGWGRETRPVINVSWHDAQAYCAWLSEQTGRCYRLPSEAEWEYACRAGSDTPFYTGKTITTKQANFDGIYTYNGSAQGEYREQTVPVGTFLPNAFGLYEMHGNVWEWCRDEWHNDYQGAPDDGSARFGEEKRGGGQYFRVLRGGSWGNRPDGARSSARYGSRPVNRGGNVGVRVLCSSPIDSLTTDGAA